VSADTSRKQLITLTIGQVQALVNSSTYTLDAVPYVDEKTQRTLVPIRFVSEALGANVKWDAATRKVTIEDGKKTIVLFLGAKKVLLNGTMQTIDCAPLALAPGRTFVPLRFVSETLGAVVDYDNTTQNIEITR